MSPFNTLIIWGISSNLNFLITLNYGIHGRVTHSLTYELSQDNAPVGNLVRLL